jgi:hypothetical protein
MIHIDETVSVNEGRTPDEPSVSPAQLWKGLVLKAENALPFVAAMTHCEILERTDGGSSARSCSAARR